MTGRPVNDKPEANGPPLATFTGPAGVANVHRLQGNGPNPEFEVWLNGVSVGLYESLGEAIAVAKDVAETGMDGPEKPEDEPPSSPRI